jgi:16S rRNA pseudouridine516 synthase
VSEPLDRFLVRRIRRTWSDVHILVQRRRVTVNGVCCPYYHRALGAGDVVAVDGVPVADGPEDGVVLCHKPAGVACSHQLEHAPLLYDLVPAHLRHPDLQAAGRLDRGTTGLIVLTIEGTLIQRLTSPGRSWKRYTLRWRGRLAADAPLQAAAGMTLPDDPVPCRPARLDLRPDADGAGGVATIELCEGRNHQVKRMVRAWGGEVVSLHRDRLGRLDLPDDLAPGAMRPARADEVARLLDAG